MKRGQCIVAGLSLTVAAIATIGWAGRRSLKTEVNGTGWYNTFADAQADAKRTHRPILLFSMFGRLDEAMPCANARTLRATLFNEPEFKEFVTNEVVPTWEMVRPVPKFEIDFGDGHKLTRTVRGNAVMYLCNEDGKVFDAFPGIYTGKDFLPAAREAIAKLANADAVAVANFHRDRALQISFVETTLSKAVMEAPTLRFVGASSFGGAKTTPAVGRLSPDRRAFLMAAERISDASLTPMTLDASVALATHGRPIHSDPKALTQEILQADSTNNMQHVRSVVHYWLASETALPTPAEARDAVLETILKIPYKDPYFGLRDLVMPGTPF